MMKITFGIIVVNGEKYLPTQLEAIYPHAHQILITEGGDQHWHKIHKSWGSTDNTVEIIKNWPDPDKKIKLIQKNWTGKNEMSRAYSAHITGDILWHIDVDEFVSPLHIPKIVDKFRTMPAGYDSIALPHFVFWGDANTIIEAKCTNKDKKYHYRTHWCTVPRIFRFNKNNNLLINHLPMGYFNPTTRATLTGTYPSTTMFINERLFCYHFSFVFPDEVSQKIRYYNNRSASPCIRRGWYDNIFMKFKENKDKWIKTDFNVQPVAHANFVERLRPFNEKLPASLTEFIKQIK